MNTTRRRSYHKGKNKLLAIALAAVLLIAIMSFIVVRINNSKSTDNTQDENSAAEIIQAEEKKQQASDRTDNKENVNETLSEVGVVINRAGQQNTGGPLNVRATVTGTSSGTCELKLTRSGQTTVSKSFDVDSSGTTVTCGSADISANDFPVSGEWELQVSIKHNGELSSPATSKVTIVK